VCVCVCVCVCVAGVCASLRGSPSSRTLYVYIYSCTPYLYIFAGVCASLRGSPSSCPRHGGHNSCPRYVNVSRSLLLRNRSLLTRVYPRVVDMGAGAPRKVPRLHGKTAYCSRLPLDFFFYLAGAPRKIPRPRRHAKTAHCSMEKQLSPRDAENKSQLPFCSRQVQTTFCTLLYKLLSLSDPVLLL